MPPHFTQPAGLIAPNGGNGGGGGTTYISAAYLPFSHPGQLIGAPSMGFATNGATATPAGGFYATAPQQKQQLQAGQQHGVGVGVGVTGGAVTNAAQPQQIAYYHTTMPPAQLQNNNSGNNNSGSNNSNSGNNSTQRGNMRGGQRSTPPQQPSYYTPYGVATAAPQPRATLVNNASAATVTPILNTRSNALNGSPAFHIPSAYCPSIPIGPPPNLTTAPLIAAAGLTAPPSGGSTGLHTYAPHLQSTTGTGAVSAVTGSFSSTSLNTAQQLSGADKVKERRHAIPIIHPVTQENILDPNSSINKKDSNCTLTPSTGSEISINQQYQLETKTDSAFKVDHQMQTETALVFTPGQAATATVTATAAATLLPLTDEDKVSVIVKDILANSGNPEEHLSFLQFNDGKF